VLWFLGTEGKEIMRNVTPYTGLIIAIVFAALVISGSLLFFALQLKQASLTPPSIDDMQLAQKIDAGIERYVQKQREEREQARAEQTRLASAKAKNVRRVSKVRDHIYGNPDAKVSLIEYSDFECPFCKRFHPTAKRLVEVYDGKVNWVYRHFPLAFHNPGAQKQAEGSECAADLGGNDAFWKYTDLIYERTRSNGKGFPLNRLVPLAKEIGLDERKFQACLDGGKMAARVGEDYTEGTQIGITGTPGNVLLNNETGAVALKPGALPLEVLKAEIDHLLN
jgi:protein-disulfide isomerase